MDRAHAQSSKSSKKRNQAERSSRDLPAAAAGGSLITLQRTVGNRAVNRLLQSQGNGPQPVQAKLLVGAPNDRFEQEADQVAARVTDLRPLTSGSAPESREPSAQAPPGNRLQGLVEGLSRAHPGMLRRQPIDDEQVTVEEEPSPEDIEPEEVQDVLAEEDLPEAEERDDDIDEMLQLKREPGATVEAPSGLLRRIGTMRGGGQPLAPRQRDLLESQFGYDFSQVRVHTDSQAAEMAQSIRARAFTVGSDVVFGAGAYSPETSAGQGLLAHELTHVVQQTAASPLSSPSRQSMGQAQAGPVQQQTSVQIQRQPTSEESQSAAVEAALLADLQKGEAVHARAYARLGQLSAGKIDPGIVEAVREQGDAAKENLDLLSASVSLLATMSESERRVALGASAIELQQFITNTDHLLIIERVVNVNVPSVFENKDEADDRLADIAEWDEEWLDANIDVGEFAGDLISVVLEEEPAAASAQVAQHLIEYQSRLQLQVKAIGDITTWIDDLEAEIQQKKTGAKILKVLRKVEGVLEYVPGRRGRRVKRPKRARRTRADRSKAGRERQRKREQRRKERKERKKEKLRAGIRRILRRRWFKPGTYAQPGGHIPASISYDVTTEETRQITALGRKFGDHHTGVKRPGTKTGNWIGDHQPVTELVMMARQDSELHKLMTEVGLSTTLRGQRLYPHSWRSARRQGGSTRAIQSKLEALARLKARR